MGPDSGRGYDLRGAQRVLFEVRTPTPGGVRALFGVGGHVATLQIPFNTAFAAQQIDFATLGLTQAELANVSILFAVQAGADELAMGGVVLVDNVRFDPRPPNPLMNATQPVLALPLGNQTFGAVSRTAAPFAPDQVLPNLATTYESSLTLLALLSQPEPTADQLRQARLVADTLVYALQHDHAAGVSGVGIPPVTSGGTRIARRLLRRRPPAA